MRLRLDQLVVDALEPSLLARFWAALLQGDQVDRDHGWSHVAAPGFPKLSFQPVTEQRAGKNRVHFDLEVQDIEEAAAAAITLGATRAGWVARGSLGAYQVMLDPEGNEFCFVSD